MRLLKLALTPVLVSPLLSACGGADEPTASAPDKSASAATTAGKTAAVLLLAPEDLRTSRVRGRPAAAVS